MCRGKPYLRHSKALLLSAAGNPAIMAQPREPSRPHPFQKRALRLRGRDGLFRLPARDRQCRPGPDPPSRRGPAFLRGGREARASSHPRRHFLRAADGGADRRAAHARPPLGRQRDHRHARGGHQPGAAGAPDFHPRACSGRPWACASISSPCRGPRCSTKRSSPRSCASIPSISSCRERSSGTSLVSSSTWARNTARASGTSGSGNWTAITGSPAWCTPRKASSNTTRRTNELILTLSHADVETRNDRDPEDFATAEPVGTFDKWEEVRLPLDKLFTQGSVRQKLRWMTYGELRAKLAGARRGKRPRPPEGGRSKPGLEPWTWRTPSRKNSTTPLPCFPSRSSACPSASGCRAARRAPTSASPCCWRSVIISSPWRSAGSTSSPSSAPT